MTKRINLLVFVSIATVFVYDVLFWLFTGFGGYGMGYSGVEGDATVGAAPVIGSISNYFILLWISVCCCLYLFFACRWRANLPKSAYGWYILLLLCNVVCIVRGCWNASGYYEWKQALTNSQGGLSQLAPLIMIPALIHPYAIRAFKFLIAALPWCLFLLPFQLLRVVASEETFARITIPSIFLLQLVPVLPYRKRLVVLVVTVTAFLLTLSWRTNELRIVALFGFLALLYSHRLFTRTVFNVIAIVLFALPVFFTISALVTGKTIFQANAGGYNQSSDVSLSGERVDLTGDTRTFLYTEVLTDLVTNDAVAFGKGSTARYHSNTFVGDEFKTGRGSVEVGALKIMMYSGLTGLVLMGIVLGLAVYYGINKTANTITKGFALFLALHWTLLFIENIPDYDLYNYALWLLIGLCFSKHFRRLTDKDIRALFHKRRQPRTTNYDPYSRPAHLLQS